MKPLLKKGTRCLLVQSRFSDFSFWNYLDVCRLVGAKYPAAPLGLMTVAALLPQEWDFKLVDENVEPLLPEHLQWADVVCCGGMLPQQSGILSVIRKAHEHQKPVVVGGPDPTSQPGIYEEADFLALGEGEVVIPLMLADWEKGVLKGRYRSSDQADMTRSPVPRFDLVRFEDYLHVGVQYSRGCPFNCEFCDIIELYGRIPRTKTVGQILRELQTLHDLGYRGHVDFVDDNFIGNKKYVKQALPAVKEWSESRRHPFFFSTEASINLAADDQLLEMMRDVDFRYVFIGIETPDDELLKLTQKKQNCRVSVTEAVKKIGSYGMIVNAGFILGFDRESDLSARHMIDCIQDSGICMAMVGLLTALPNTQLTRRLEKEGRLLAKGMQVSDSNEEIDQTTSGLNFVTDRPRRKVLSDYLKIIEAVYAPGKYYERVAATARNLNPSGKYRPGAGKILNMARAFARLCFRAGLASPDGWRFWKLIAAVLAGRPRSIEAAVNLAAMYLHFQKQSLFLRGLLTRKINGLEDARAREFRAA
ncbi:MAG TPA: B12-binding domain-containing radical SAM protein [bacterium]|nr:B12-binding domain-containing radical SAM protein [bacterium]